MCIRDRLIVPDVFFQAVDRLQIKFVDSLWSVAEVLFERNIMISLIVVSPKYHAVVLASCFWFIRFAGSRFGRALSVVIVVSLVFEVLDFAVKVFLSASHT